MDEPVLIVMVVVGVALVVIAMGGAWYVVTRGRQAALVTERDFNDTYDERVRNGEIAAGDRDAAWREFHAWQVETEQQRRSWEEPEDA